MLFIREEQGLSLSDVCRRLELPKATVSRMLAYLTELGYLNSDTGNNSYSLGPQLIALGNHAKRRIDLKILAHPYLTDLSQTTRETVKLSVLRNDTVYVIDTIDSPRSMRIVVDQGAFFPPHIGAAGKLLLAFQDDEQISAYLKKPLDAFTDRTIVEAAALKAALTEIRERGFARDNEEESLGIKAFAAPVRDELGVVIGAVSIPFLANVYNEDRERRLLKDLKAASAAISSAIGYGGCYE